VPGELTQALAGILAALLLERFGDLAVKPGASGATKILPGPTNKNGADVRGRRGVA